MKWWVFTSGWCEGLVFGVRVVTPAGVQQVLVKHGKASGVLLNSGQETTSDVVSQTTQPIFSQLSMTAAVAVVSACVC